MSFSQKRDKNLKYSSHISLDKSFDQSVSSPEKKKKKTKIIQFDIKKKKKNDKRPATSSTTELTLFPKKSKFSFNTEIELFPESTKSAALEKNILTVEQVIKTFVYKIKYKFLILYLLKTRTTTFGGDDFNNFLLNEMMKIETMNYSKSSVLLKKYNIIICVIIHIFIYLFVDQKKRKNFIMYADFPIKIYKLQLK